MVEEIVIYWWMCGMSGGCYYIWSVDVDLELIVLDKGFDWCVEDDGFYFVEYVGCCVYWVWFGGGY